HHPLAELTRSALKILAFDWQPEDWFAALKTGLMHEHEEDIDRLENEALARGWKAKDWRSQFQVSEDPPLEKWLEPLRKKLVAPFEELALALRAKASGAVLAEGLRRFWLRLQIGEQLERWS